MRQRSLIEYIVITDLLFFTAQLFFLEANTLGSKLLGEDGRVSVHKMRQRYGLMQPKNTYCVSE